MRSSTENALLRNLKVTVLMAYFGVFALVGCGDDPEMTVLSYEVIPSVVDAPTAEPARFEIRLNASSSEGGFEYEIYFVAPGKIIGRDVSIPSLSRFCDPSHCPRPISLACTSRISPSDLDSRRVRCTGGSGGEGIDIPRGEYQMTIEFRPGASLFDQDKRTYVSVPFTLR